MKNILDLKKKEEKEVKIVIKKVLKKRSIKSEALLFLIVTVLASVITWGTSRAQEFFNF